MAEIYLASTLLMGLLLIAVAVVVRRSGQRATPSGGAGRGYAAWSSRTEPETSRLDALANDPLVWTISFVVLALAFFGGAILLIQGGPSIGAGVAQTVLLAIGGAVLLGYVFFGSYVAVRDRIGQTAAAVGISALVLGTLLVLGIVVNLVIGA